MAEALETTVLDDKPNKKADMKEPPKVLDDDAEDDEKFEEMSKQPPLILDEQDQEDSKMEDSSTFKEMSNEDQADPNDPSDHEEEVLFKITEDNIEDLDDDEDTNANMNANLIDVETMATSPPLSAKTVDLLGNDIVKSIEKANILYEGHEDLNNLFKPDIPSSEDDLEFKPVISSKKKRKKNKSQSSTNSELGSSFADSESSDAHMELASNGASNIASKSNTEGWSFEADDLDVNKLLAEVSPSNQEEEKAALEDVFKFDSELGPEDSSVNDKSTPASGVVINMSTSLNNYEISSGGNEAKSLSQSMTYGGCSTTTSNSESSVGNSPNPRASSKKKGKSKKKKR